MCQVQCAYAAFARGQVIADGCRCHKQPGTIAVSSKVSTQCQKRACLLPPLCRLLFEMICCLSHINPNSNRNLILAYILRDPIRSFIISRSLYIFLFYLLGIQSFPHFLIYEAQETGFKPSISYIIPP